MSTNQEQQNKIARQVRMENDNASNELISLENAIEEALLEARDYICGDIQKINDSIEQHLASIDETLKKKAEESFDYILSEEERAQLKGDPGQNYVLTEADKTEIAGKVKVPTTEVKTVVEKTTITKEIPIVTEVVKEVAKYQTPEETRDGLETLVGSERLKYTAIDGLEELLKNNGAKGVQLVGGTNGIFVYINGVKKAIMKAFNLKAGSGITLAFSVVNGLNTITINSLAGGTPVLGEYPTIVGTTITLAHTPTLAGVALSLNGERMKVGVDYTLSGAVITMLFTPAPNSTVVVDYTY